MRSVVVVLPASICAMIPMFRTLARSAAVWVATLSVLRTRFSVLPAVMREGLVGLRHLVCVLAALDARPEAVAGIEQLVHEPLGHRLLPTLARVRHQPAQGEGGGARCAHLHRDLVGRAADAAAADLKGRLDVVERAVDNTLGQRALALPEDLVRQRGNERRAVYRIGD